MPSLGNINHFVVLMLENRSFDNIFGGLYHNRPDFDGLSGNETNKCADGTPVSVWHSEHTDNHLKMPDPDPGESADDMHEQLFGNADGNGEPTMSGFITNYVSRRNGNPADIMHYFHPDQLPALRDLAQSFAVCDRWFASAPNQTWPNRFFVHTGTANGYPNNMPLHFPYRMPTIFKILDKHAAPDWNGWKIYFHDFPQSLTLADLWGSLDRFRPIDDFFADAANGTLPSYSFIEPRYYADLRWPNDMHPPHHVGHGDELIAQIYNRLRESPCWSSTMLIITFDEHGGCYDHVPPPQAPQPEPPRDPHYPFDRFGPRVPAVVASPYIQPGTVFRAPAGAQPFDHTSIIKTLRKRYGVAQPLTGRDTNAPDLELVLTLDAPTDAGRKLVNANPVPADDAGLETARMAPPNDFQRAMAQAAAFLHPLQEGGSVAAHISKILAGWAPDLPAHATGAEARNYLGKVLKDLGVKGSH